MNRLISMQLLTNRITPFLIASYVSVLVVMYLFGECSTDLVKSSDFMIGQATLRGESVNQRVSNFYLLLMSGIVIFIAIYWIYSQLIKRDFRLRFEREFQVLLILQISLWSVNAFTSVVELSEQLIHAALFLLLFLDISSRWISWSFIETAELQSQFLAFIGCTLFVENIFISSTVFILLFFVFHYVERLRSFLLAFITGLPLFLVIALESGMIANQRGVNGIVVVIFVAVVLIFLLAWLASRRISWHKLIFSIQTPLLLAGITLFSSYAFQIEQHSEVFESGNRFNSLMMMESFGKWPIVDFLSSHLISDYFWGWIYTCINGYSTTIELMMYNAFDHVASVLIVFYFLKVSLGKRFGLILFMLFLPYFGFIVPLYYSFALLPVVFLIRFSRNQSRKDLAIFFLLATGLVFWRIDIGIATVFAAALTFLIMMLRDRFHRKWVLIIGGFGSLIYGTLFLMYIFWRKEVALQAKHYFGGNQSHGYDVLTYSQSNWFYIDYVMLPALIAFIMIYLLMRHKDIVINKLYYGLFFLGGFYFMNFQRGLVRHSFVEQNESYVSSFGWMIIGLFIIGFWKVSISKKWIPAVMLTGILCSISGVKSWSNLIDHTKSISVTEIPDFTKGKLNRVKENEAFNAEILPVINFLKQHTSKDQTFIDLSNSPMLYFYTNRAVPSVFMQYMQNTIDPFLQDENCKLLEKLDIPYVLFRQSPETFMDHTDGISNKVRYFRITAYIYRHYKPMKTIGKFEIWERKGASTFHQSEASYDHGAEVWELGLLPYYWVNEAEFSKKILSFDDERIVFPKLKANNFLVMTIESKSEDIVALIMEGVHFTFQLKEGRNEYRIPIGVSYNMYNSRNPVLRYAISNNSAIISEIKIIELP